MTVWQYSFLQHKSMFKLLVELNEKAAEEWEPILMTTDETCHRVVIRRATPQPMRADP